LVSIDVVRPFQYNDNESSNSGSDNDEVAAEVDGTAAVAATAKPLEDTDDVAYKSVEGRYINVSLLAISASCAHAPLGMSKYAHLSDGCMDLILVDDVPRKEFVRYLQRFGNIKNQLDLPFVTHHRCKEVLFQLRSLQTWVKDGSSIANEDSEVSTSLPHHTESGEYVNTAATVDDARESDSESEKDGDNDSAAKADPQKTSVIVNKDADHRTRRHSSLTQHLHINGLFGRIKGRSSRSSTKTMLPETENTTKTTKTEMPKTFWNVNNEICDAGDLRFIVHSGLVSIYGSGVPRDYHPADVWMPCLSIFK
jgi:hypothetical protein